MDRLVHRGPDDAGDYRDDHAALGFRRLSIIDLAGGHQPLSNEDGTVWTVFNGEIYNFPALRRRLEAKGHDLRSSGDTEVLVHLYEDEGTRMFSLLRGMFALAIWDAPRRTLVLARDRLGQKPLVYRHDGGRLVFASELKALLALPESDRTAPDRSPGARSLPLLRLCTAPADDPGGNAQASAGSLCGLARRCARDRALLEPDWNAERERPIEEDIEELRATLGDAVREQMIADVPLGAFLSGGIDSTIIVGLDAAGVEPAGEDVRDRLSRPEVRRDALRRAGRAAPGDRAPDVHRGTEGVGDPAGPGLAVRRAVRRQLGLADLVRLARDPALGHRRPDRRRRRRALRRLRPLPGAGPDRAVPAPACRPAPPARWDDGSRLAPLGPVEDPAPQAPASLRAHQRAGRVSLPGLDDDLRRGRPAGALFRRPARFAGLGRGGAARSIRGRPGRVPGRGLRRRPAAATGSPAPWSPTS